MRLPGNISAGDRETVNTVVAKSIVFFTLNHGAGLAEYHDIPSVHSHPSFFTSADSGGSSGAIEALRDGP